MLREYYLRGYAVSQRVERLESRVTETELMSSNLMANFQKNNVIVVEFAYLLY